MAKGTDDPEDLFKVNQVVPGDKTSPSEAETGCTLQWPA
jgi:branched-chain amino acid transport system substrate-binding protein